MKPNNVNLQGMMSFGRPERVGDATDDSIQV